MVWWDLRFSAHWGAAEAAGWKQSGSQGTSAHSQTDRISAKKIMHLPHPGKRVPGRNLCDSATVSVGSHPAILNIDARCYAPAKGGSGNIAISRYVVGQPLHDTPILLWSEYPVVFERGHRVGRRGNCHKVGKGVSCNVPIAGPSQLRVRLLVNPETRCNGVSIISTGGATCPKKGLCTLPEFVAQVFHHRPQGC